MRLAFASFLMLLVELALIRWTAANNVYLASATNFVLLASFLGIGLGFLNARSRLDFLRWTPLTFLALVGFVLAFPVILRSLNVGTKPYRGLQGMLALPRPVSLSVISVLSVAVMAGFGQAVSGCSSASSRSAPTGWTSWAASPGLPCSPHWPSSSCHRPLGRDRRRRPGRAARPGREVVAVGSRAAVVVLLGVDSFAPGSCGRRITSCPSVQMGTSPRCT